ncbi:farnesoate epoxidase-like [Macrosteles quadrilineatus]|uniref:farnesoate epoxidase-like n=1 Tax=Macrosteles quadrilineatus TaxID=74068 RepID=UPI0023E2D9D9|nr:farnesoate epoxidase-like [Macrosteles quadrilineatus]
MLGTILLLFSIALLSYLWRSRRPTNYPPGPTPLPIVGNTFQMPKAPKHLYQAVEEWSKVYGEIIGLTVGNLRVVLVTGADNVLAALRKEEFQDRPDTFSIRERSFGELFGIFFSSGEQWMSSRKFTVKQMRAYGKNEKEDLIQDEISQLMETFKDGSVIQGTGIFGVASVNVIWTMLANKRIDFNDVESRKFLGSLNAMMRRGTPAGGSLVDISPIFKYIDTSFKLNTATFREVQKYVQQTIKEHEEILDPNNPMDLIDHYLIEMKKNTSKLFTEKDLIMIALDLFVAGAESVSNSVEFVLLYMILYPEIQEKMQAEIDHVLARARKPKLDDKLSMHYLMAVLTEVERINSVVPTNVPHTCTKDTTFGGYFIPKGTMVSMNLRSLGYDTKYWSNPEEFDPRRHLNKEGVFVKPSVLATFGGGPRVCVGEIIARNIMFLFTATFFEKYTVSLPPGEKEPSTLSMPGFTSAPQPFKVKIQSRY